MPLKVRENHVSYVVLHKFPVLHDWLSFTQLTVSENSNGSLQAKGDKKLMSTQVVAISCSKWRVNDDIYKLQNELLWKLWSYKD
jgi:hypothetical protein